MLPVTGPSNVYICFRRRLSPVAKASVKELSASYSTRLDSCPDGELGTGLNTSTTAPLGGILEKRLRPYKARNSLLTLRVHPQVLLDVLLDGDPAIIDVDAWAENVDPLKHALVLLQDDHA